MFSLHSLIMKETEHLLCFRAFLPQSSGGTVDFEQVPDLSSKLEDPVAANHPDSRVNVLGRKLLAMHSTEVLGGAETNPNQAVGSICPEMDK